MLHFECFRHLKLIFVRCWEQLRISTLIFVCFTGTGWNKCEDSEQQLGLSPLRNCKDRQHWIWSHSRETGQVRHRLGMSHQCLMSNLTEWLRESRLCHWGFRQVPGAGLTGVDDPRANTKKERAVKLAKQLLTFY